jgi:hypothetical protein
MNKWTLTFVVTFGFLARTATFQTPVFDHHAWRQADSATIARNFYRDGINPWYPEIDARGAAEHGYVGTGLELHAIVFAAVSRVTGFSPFVGRLISALCFPVSAMFLWIFCRSRYDDTYALSAVFVYALGLPLVIYSERAIWNEPLLMMFSLASLAAAQWYLNTRRLSALFTLALTLAALAAIKPQWLVVLAPIAALWFERRRLKAIRSPGLWIVSVVACAAAAATMWHMQRVDALTHLSFGAADKLFHADDMSLHFGYVIFRRLFRDVLGPLGLAAYVVGVGSCARHQRWVEPAGALGFLVYLVLVSRGNRVHDYYQLVIGPYAAITIPAGIFAAARAVTPRLPGTWTIERFVATTLWLMLLFSFVRSVGFHSWYDVDLEKVQFCSLLKPVLKPSDRIAFADYNSPDILFCLDRRGWLTSTTEMPATEARLLRDSGAAVLAMPRASASRLGGLGETVASTTNWVAIRFK